MALARIRALIWFISRINKIIIFRINNRKSFLFNENYLMTKGLIIKHKDLIKKVSTLSNVKNFP